MTAADKPSGAAKLKGKLILACYGALLFAASLALLIKTKAIYVSVWVHDNFTYMDGAYRILKGQVPHVDFITPVGLLGYWLPYLGLKTTGSFPLALPASDLIMTAMALVLALAIARRRLRLFPGLLFISGVWILLAAPLNPGDTAVNLSYSMFYNRYGWALLFALLVLYLDIDSPALSDKLIDAVAAGIILWMLLYIKVSYFAVGLAFLPLMALKTRYHRHVAIMAAALLLAGVLGMELILPGLNRGYFNDLLMAFNSSGAVRGGKYAAINFLYRNLWEIILAAFMVGLAAKAKNLRWIDCLFVAFVLLASSALVNQNAQTRNLVTLWAVAVWAWQRTLTAVSQSADAAQNGMTSAPKAILWGVAALAVLLVAQPFAARLYGLAIMQARSKTMPTSRAMDIGRLKNMYVYKDQDYLSGIDRDSYTVKEIYALRQRMRRDWLTVQEYVETLEDGVKLVGPQLMPGDSVIVMDMVNPFNFILGTRPPRRSYSFLHLNRTFNLDKARPAEAMLHDATLVMIPNYPIEVPERDALLEVFGNSLQRDFKEVARDRYWTVMRRK